MTVAIDVDGDDSIQRRKLGRRRQRTNIESAIPPVLQVARTRIIHREGHHSFLVVWLKQLFQGCLTVLVISAELIPKQRALAVQLIPEVNGILGHCSFRRLKVTAKDGVNASVIVKVFGIYPERMLIGYLIKIIRSEEHTSELQSRE